MGRVKVEKLFQSIIKKKGVEIYLFLVVHPFGKHDYTVVYPSLESYLGGLLRHLLAIFLGDVLNTNISQGLICIKILHQHSGYKDNVVEPLPFLINDTGKKKAILDS